MAAVPVSPHKASCAACGHALEGYLDRQVCPACGKSQPMNAAEDYFSVFGLERRFAVDRLDLESRFYKLSRALHPDRFTTEGAESQRLSLEKMSLVNQAYQTLKNPEALRDYFLQLEGMKSDARESGRPSQGGSQIPAELAEGWFELQDALMEDPSEAQGRLSAFEGELKGLQERTSGELQSLEAEIDRVYEAQGQSPKEMLERLARMVQSRSYLKSMERDVERIHSRLRNP